MAPRDQQSENIMHVLRKFADALERGERVVGTYRHVRMDDGSDDFCVHLIDPPRPKLHLVQ